MADMTLLDIANKLNTHLRIREFDSAGAYYFAVSFGDGIWWRKPDGAMFLIGRGTTEDAALADFCTKVEGGELYRQQPGNAFEQSGDSLHVSGLPLVGSVRELLASGSLRYLPSAVGRAVI